MKSYQKLKEAFRISKEELDRAQASLKRCETIVCPNGVQIEVKDGHCYMGDISRHAVVDLRYIIFEAERRGLIEPEKKMALEPNAWAVEIKYEDGTIWYYDDSNPAKPWASIEPALHSAASTKLVKAAKSNFPTCAVRLVSCRLKELD